MKENEINALPNDFKFKKKFGQNFLRDKNLLRAIVDDALVTESDNVLEIGAGAGALTEQICAVATKGKVISVEVDNTLRDFLKQKFGDTPNLEFVFGDILKIDPKVLADKFNSQPFRVVANLPYYISSPIIFYLIESGLPIQSITVMLQKELVDRITAKPGGKDYGAITVILSMYGKVTRTRDVPRQMFTPMPNVDSAILRIEINKSDVPIRDVARVVKTCFAMRRKTLANNLIDGFAMTRDEVNVLLSECQLLLDVRAEKLSKEQYITLANLLKDKIK